MTSAILNRAALEIVNTARTYSERMGHAHVGTEHLLLGLMESNNLMVHRFRRDHKLELDAAVAETVVVSGRGECLPGSERHNTVALSRVYDWAREEAHACGVQRIMPVHLLLALLPDPSRQEGDVRNDWHAAHFILQRLNVNTACARQGVLTHLKERVYPLAEVAEEELPSENID